MCVAVPGHGRLLQALLGLGSEYSEPSIHPGSRTAHLPTRGRKVAGLASARC